MHNGSSPPWSLEESMARLDHYCLATLVALSAATAACGAPTEEAVPPECQIQAEGEKTPGYPYDLEKFANEVLPVLTANCGAQGCHGAPNGTSGFTVWVDAQKGNCSYAKTFNTLTSFIDLVNPENSAVLVSVSGALPSHPVQYAAGDPKLDALTNYIKDASDRYKADGGGNTPPPGASPFNYDVFQSTIQPILDNAEGRGCAASGCHGTAAGGFTLVANPAPGSPEMEANFIAVTGRANLTSPETSVVLVQATTKHGGGASATADATQGAALLAWIQDAADNNGGGPVTGCAPVERFNVNVFRDEILPILRGDVDLNNAGGAGVGCTRGPCHGTDRGPGVLYLGDANDPSTNLQNFVCFADLINPSQSEILLCPLNDPRCRKYPHPGQDVFTGGDDLNYQRVLAFLYGATGDGVSTPLDFAFFVRRINPILNDLQAVEAGAQGRTCSDTVACHGVSVVGQAAPNGSNFPVIPNAADKARLTFNFASAASFVNFLAPEESSLFLYPTNEIANVEDHPLATGLPHPGGEDFAVDSQFAVDILKWAGGLRPNNQGFVTDWLVAGDYPASRITDATPIDEINLTPQIFDPMGSSTFNAGEWDALFSAQEEVNLNQAFPRDATAGRIAYAVGYLVNTTTLDLTAQMDIRSNNAIRVYVGNTLVAQSDNAANGVSAIAQIPSYANSKKSTRVLIKVFQRADDEDFAFSVQLRDELGNLLTDQTQELVLLLGPQGGI
jgi:hypothetical protein